MPDIGRQTVGLWKKFSVARKAVLRYPNPIKLLCSGQFY
jgi:hypothetical protein